LAEEAYKAILAETPSNQLAAKRLIALARETAGSKTGRARDEANLRVLEQLNECVERCRRGKRAAVCCVYVCLCVCEWAGCVKGKGRGNGEGDVGIQAPRSGVHPTSL
jgi:hypothetical protein